MKINPKLPPPGNKSLLFAIEDMAKLLRNEVKKTESKLKKAIPINSSSSSFVHNIEQIAQLLRDQTHKVVSSPKPRTWKQISK
jgi:hypothetical protein